MPTGRRNDEPAPRRRRNRSLDEVIVARGAGAIEAIAQFFGMDDTDEYDRDDDGGRGRRSRDDDRDDDDDDRDDDDRPSRSRQGRQGGYFGRR